jgi:hypothetical protein
VPGFHCLIRDFSCSAAARIHGRQAVQWQQAVAPALVLQLRADREHSRLAAKDVPPAILRAACLPEGATRGSAAPLHKTI